MRNKALTLIELLIASSILVVVMVTIYSAFHSGIFGYQNINETIDVYQTARLILERLNLDLRNSFAYSNEKAKFFGTQNEISFLTLINTFIEDRIISEYSYVHYKQEEGNKLMRLCRKNHEALKDDSNIQPEELASGVEIKFTYGYLPAGEQEIRFKDTWASTDAGDEQKVLPLAVRVNLTIKGKIEQKFERTIYLSLATTL